MNADGSRLVNVSNTPLVYEDVRPVWSPDGKWVAFTSWDDINGGDSTFVVDADGSARQLVAKLALGPTWSRNGNRIAYFASSDPYGTEDIYTVPVGH